MSVAWSVYHSEYTRQFIEKINEITASTLFTNTTDTFELSKLSELFKIISDKKIDLSYYGTGTEISSNTSTFYDIIYLVKPVFSENFYLDSLVASKIQMNTFNKGVKEHLKNCNYLILKLNNETNFNFKGTVVTKKLIFPSYTIYIIQKTKDYFKLKIYK